MPGLSAVLNDTVFLAYLKKLYKNSFWKIRHRGCQDDDPFCHLSKINYHFSSYDLYSHKMLKSEEADILHVSWRRKPVLGLEVVEGQKKIIIFIERMLISNK